jgi:hypothetical protein
MKRALIVLFIATIALPAWSQEVPPPRIVGGYVTGKGYMDMDGLEKKAYLMGLLEGMFLAPAFGAPEISEKWLLDCTNQVGLNDIRSYLFQYILRRDELHENQSPLKAYRAIKALCGERGFAPAAQ